jgi:hypothetical protein
MKISLAKLAAVIAAAIVIKKIADSRRVCLYGPAFKVCNY